MPTLSIWSSLSDENWELAKQVDYPIEAECLKALQAYLAPAEKLSEWVTSPLIDSLAPGSSPLAFLQCLLMIVTLNPATARQARVKS